MASKARQALEDNAADVDRLLEIHETIGGTGKGRKHGVAVLNKSAIVLITAIWEAYCEDLAAEALDHIVNKVPSAAALPLEMKKLLAKELKADKNELAVWDLADLGWKSRAKAKLAALSTQRNWKFNSPKSEPTVALFSEAIGIPDVSAGWHWKNMTREGARKKLDEYVTLRGNIAHRGDASASCRKKTVVDYFNHVKLLAAKTGGKVNTYVKEATGTPLWKK